ncbi:SigE family RNA polymerase sigma factor [Kibdelosporangium lantanae]|uniref:SigE family RNA polymerase sigma factor n=1 Tax=Kibdelosporangium lantanae TaxID=1497396 RepID=A0ABW3MHN9_9PSEU
MRQRELDPAFEEFVRASSASLLRTAYLLTGDRGHAEDLLQTTLLRVAWRWSAASEQPDAYARRVLVNLSRDRWRNLRRRVREHHQQDLPQLPVDDDTDRVTTREALMPALRELPTRQREVVVLRFFADLSVAETAQALRCSEGTVKAYTSRALTKLRQLLDVQEIEVRQT